MKFNETSIPVNYSLDLKSKMMFEWDPQDADKIYATLVASMSRFLAIVKSKEAKKVALVMKDLKGNFKMAGIVEYHENETKDLPGNWSYTISFDEKSIEDANVFLTTETRFEQIVANVAHNLYGMMFKTQTYIHDMFGVAVDTLLKYLDDNAVEGKTVDVSLDGYAVFSTGIEDGNKVFAAVPSEAMKVIIKDDAAL